MPLREIYPMDLLRCYYYYCPPWISETPTEDEIRRQETYDGFRREIEELDRWALRHGKLQKRWDGQKEIFEQKRVDVLLSVDLVRHAAAGHIQHAILLAGDSDFIPAVQSAKDSGVTVSLWCGPTNTVHSELVSRCDSTFEINWSNFPQSHTNNTKPSSQKNHFSNKKDQKESEPPKTPKKPQSRQSSSSQVRNSPRLQSKNSNGRKSSHSKSRVHSRVREEKSATQNQESDKEKETTKKSWKDRIKKITGL